MVCVNIKAELVNVIHSQLNRNHFFFSDQIHNMNCYVRDFYFFRRNFYPQLSLVHMNPEEASEKLQHQVRVFSGSWWRWL